MPKQTTLLQTWGYSGNENLFQDGGEDLDSLLVEALDQSTTTCDPQTRSGKDNDFEGNIDGFDHDAGRTWIYPINFPVRTYQLSISETCLYQNTLVSLPTGLGKTFIAAVVMYNFYRWYPEGVVVFLAPTKPLVAQQIQACFNIMGIPAKDVAEMTGNNPVHSRKKDWSSKRVFFLTPQVLANDLSRGLLPTSSIKCVVIDEAHKARGEYAYCQVVKELKMSGSYFRVVALSATPGNDVKSVQDVLKNLGISKIELRTEDSPDIMPYTFQRNVDKVVVPLSTEMEEVKGNYTSLVENYLRRLQRVGVISNKKEVSVSSISKFSLLQSRNEFRQNPPERIANDRSMKGSIESNFASCISLLHAYELLLQHGLRPFYNFLLKTTDANTGNKRLKSELTQNHLWTVLMDFLQKKFDMDSSNSILNSSRPNLSTQFSQNPSSKDISYGHPKLNKLLQIVSEHFQSKGDTPSRVMIFSQYRDSVQEIVACLHSHRPMVRAMEFIGQAGTKAKKGLTQKEQIEIIRRFREGGYNTLVSTCVGEEGLDIGEVDLIICFDVSKSPIQLIQRMGRTGRKRSGRIVVLVTKGKEEQAYNQCLYSKKSINKAILDKNKLVNFLDKSPRMVPLSLKPKCHKMEMMIKDFEDSTAPKPAGKGKKSSKKSANIVQNRKENSKIDNSTEDPFESSVLSTSSKVLQAKTSRSKGKTVEKLISSFSMYSSMLDTPASDEDETCADKDIQILSSPQVLSEEVDPSSAMIIDNCDETEDMHTNEEIAEDKNQSEIDENEFDDLYSGEINLDAKRLQSDSLEENEDFSTLETARFNYDEILEVYEDIKKELACVSGHKPVMKVKSSHQTSTPRCIKLPKISQRSESPAKLSLSPLNVKSSINSHHNNETANFDMDFDHEDFFQEIGSDISNKSTPKRDLSRIQKSLYSATQLASYINKSSCHSSETLESSKLTNSSKRRSSLAKRTLHSEFSSSQANFDIELNSDEDMFADSLNDDEEELIINCSEKRAPSPKKTRAFTPIIDSNKTVFNSSKVNNSTSLISSPSSNKVKRSRVSFFDESSMPNTSSKKLIATNDESTDDSIVLLFEGNKGQEDTKAKNDTPKGGSRALLTQHSPLVAIKKRRKFNFESDSESESSFNVPNHLCRSKAKGVNMFINKDVEIDNDEGSSDEFVDESLAKDLDCYEESFIDDATQMDIVDHSAMYLHASKEQEVRTGKFKMPSKPLAPITSEIYSQLPNEESEEEYENDSFCVDDDFVEFSDSKGDGENTMALIQENQAETYKRSRIRRPVNDSDESSDDESNKVLSIPMVEESPQSKPNDEDKECILINSSEFHSCHELISNLKYTFHRRVSVRPFNGAGFILSPRLAVDRFAYSTFLNGGQRCKILPRCQQMNELYERPFIILELDEESKTFNQRTKYADMILSQISQSNIRLLFSKNQRTSAELISNLLAKEAQKGFSFKSLLLNKRSIFSDEDFKVVSFYKSVPGIGVGMGYLLSSNYSSIASFAKTAVATLMRKGNLDNDKARKIQDYLQRTFIPELTHFGK